MCERFTQVVKAGELSERGHETGGGGGPSAELMQGQPAVRACPKIEAEEIAID